MRLHHSSLSDGSPDVRWQRYVAIKVVVSEAGPESRERQVLRMLSAASSAHPGSKHVVQLIDDFQHTGPNGTHSCLVFEVLGPNVPTVISARFIDGRLPGTIAKEVCKQVLLGLNFLHQHQIGHGGALRSTSTGFVSVIQITDVCQTCTRETLPLLHHPWTSYPKQSL